MLRLNLKPSPLKPFVLIALFSTLFVYAGFAGGDHYEVYLNKKLIAKQHVSGLSSALMNLQLEKANENELLTVYYSHCGAIGKGRKMTVKNEQNKVVKEWKFADAKGADGAMTIRVKDILELKKNNTGTLHLYYFAADHLPKGRMLASINPAGKNITLRRTMGDFPSVYTAGDFESIAQKGLMRK